MPKIQCLFLLPRFSSRFLSRPSIQKARLPVASTSALPHVLVSHRILPLCVCFLIPHLSLSNTTGAISRSGRVWISLFFWHSALSMISLKTNGLTNIVIMPTPFFPLLLCSQINLLAEILHRLPSLPLLQRAQNQPMSHIGLRSLLSLLLSSLSLSQYLRRIPPVLHQKSPQLPLLLWSNPHRLLPSRPQSLSQTHSPKSFLSQEMAATIPHTISLATPNPRFVSTRRPPPTALLSSSVLRLERSLTVSSSVPAPLLIHTAPKERSISTLLSAAIGMVQIFSLGKTLVVRSTVKLNSLRQSLMSIRSIP